LLVHDLIIRDIQQRQRFLPHRTFKKEIDRQKHHADGIFE